MLAPQVSVVSPQGYVGAEGGAAYTAEDCENKCHSHFHDTVGPADSMHHHHHDYHHILHHHHSQNHHPHSHSHSYSEEHFQQAGVATLAWMVIMGDGLHNFSDGLAIGECGTSGTGLGRGGGGGSVVAITSCRPLALKYKLWTLCKPFVLVVTTRAPSFPSR